ncbi:hypothetical protein PsYK624_161620 [Phanerochaete sordida]|uniref:DUF6534 domain-containing protein n=1 Tax=Phanerochaete sordida TaxID=48140 RepID=A0A9P3GQA8_9APHY|nr:hypothetical protein PsYK624_161620 [Phanerochaete sordida]
MPAPAPALPSHAFLNLTLGALLLGCFASAILFGILCQQCFTFFRRFTKEGLALRCSILTLWGIATAHMALSIHTNYTLVITDIGVLSNRIPVSVAGIVVVTALADILVRGWFMYRLWILSDRRWSLQVMPVTCTIAILALALYIAVELRKLGTLDFTPTLNRAFAADLALTIATDFYTAAGICWFLWRRRARVAFRGTRHLIDSVMVYTINTGLITSLAWLICLITVRPSRAPLARRPLTLARAQHVTMPSSFVAFGFYLAMNDLYNICLLASLNARKTHRRDARAAGPGALPLASLQSSLQTASAASGARPRASESVEGKSRVEIVCSVSQHTDVEGFGAPGKGHMRRYSGVF